MINSNLTQVKTYVGTDGKIHFVDSAGADTALNFSKGVQIKTGSVSKTVGYSNHLKSTTISTGVTGYTNGLVQITSSQFISGAGGYGVVISSSINPSTGVITVSFYDPAGGMTGLHDVTCTYVVWK